VGLVPSFLLAVYSMTEPWAKARVAGLFHVSRSPEAALLLAISLAGMVAASVAVAARGKKPALASGVHFVTGALMIAIAWAAFGLIRQAGMKILFIPFASVKPGPGLRHFLAASVLVAMLGALEGCVAIYRKHRLGRPSREFLLEGTRDRGAS
jgi:hypothetical protein